jgi:uncharacterized protein
MSDTSRRGFASMDPAKKREIASRGGRAAHEKGTAHEFTPDEARQAGKKGGERVSQNRGHMASIGRRGGEAVSRDREHMARIGRKGGEAVSRDRQHMATIGREGGESRANKGDMDNGGNGNHGGGSAGSHDKSEQAPPMSHAQSMEPTQKDGPSAH